VIILALSPLGNGFRAVAIALGLFSIPPVLTNAYVGMSGVDDDVLEAARGMGMSTAQVILRVELPLALPLIAAGVRTAAVQLVATTTVASEIGAGGFGRYVIDGLEVLDYPQVVGGALLVIALALATELGLGALQRLLTPGRVRRRDAVPAALGGPAVTAG
jgi:osmoprotectant transport system permease protein